MFPIVLSLMFKDECKLIKYAGMPVSHKQTKSRFVSIMVKYILLPGICPVSRYQIKLQLLYLTVKFLRENQNNINSHLHPVYVNNYMCIHAQTVMQ